MRYSIIRTQHHIFTNMVVRIPFSVFDESGTELVSDIIVVIFEAEGTEQGRACSGWADLGAGWEGAVVKCWGLRILRSFRNSEWLEVPLKNYKYRLKI